MELCMGKREHWQRLKPVQVRPRRRVRALGNGNPSAGIDRRIAAAVNYHRELGRRLHPGLRTHSSEAVALLSRHNAITKLD